MSRGTNPTRRGLTLIELMLSLSVTVMIAGSIAAMMAAVNAGVSTKRDGRTSMIRLNALHARLAAYIQPARCILDVSSNEIVLWLHDERENDTVNVSEVRWIRFRPASQSIVVSHADFSALSPRAEAVADFPINPNVADWTAIRQTLSAGDQLDVIRVMDGVTQFDPAIAGAALNARAVSIDFAVDESGQSVASHVTQVIIQHRLPNS